MSDNRTRATTFINMETGFWPMGTLMEKFMLGPQLNKTIKIAQSEFKAYVERETASENVA